SPGTQLRSDPAVPVGQHTMQRVLEGFGGRQLRSVDGLITLVEPGVSGIAGLQRRRWNVVAAAPDLHLRLAVLLDGLRLVESLERAVVALVQPPGGLDRNPH